MSEPTIPHGYKQVFGQAQKGDGIWDYAAGKFVKVKREYPWGAPLKPRIIIRSCAVQQPKLISELPEEGMCLD